MSTSDPRPQDLARAPESAEVRDVLSAVSAAMAQLPDPAVIGRMANEFFAALPGQPAGVPAQATASGLATDAASTGGGFTAPAPLVPPAVLPTEADLRALPATLLAGADAAGQAFAWLPEATTASYAFLDALAGPALAARPASAPAATVPGLPGLAAFDFRPSVVPVPVSGSRPFDAASIRRDFPILEERVNGKRIVWLDNAATTQKPRAVIERLRHFYEHENSNIHRAAHALAARATDAYEAARETVRRFLNASSSSEIVFVRGATEAINLAAQGWGRRHVGKDDEIVVTWLEHHANIVPWQQLCAEKGAVLKVAPVDETGQVLLDEYERLFTPRTRIAAIAHVSNALGTVTPVAEMVEIAHRHGARVLVDGAQAVSHLAVDVQALDCDFYAFSGHKVFAPTGIGVLFGKRELLDTMSPWQGGGNMIADVTFERTVYQPAPARFEAGTGSIADAVGLGAALEYLEQVGMANVTRYEHDLLVYTTGEMLRVPGLRLVGTAPEKASVLSFVLDGYRTEEVGAALDREGIAVRSGHHCAQPILRRFGLESTVRPSLAFYNTCEDVDALVAVLRRLSGRRGVRTGP